MKFTRTKPQLNTTKYMSILRRTHSKFKPLSFAMTRITSLALGNHDCPSAREMTLKDMGWIGHFQTRVEHQTLRNVCIILVIYSQTYAHIRIIGLILYFDKKSRFAYRLAGKKHYPVNDIGCEYSNFMKVVLIHSDINHWNVSSHVWFSKLFMWNNCDP